MEQEGTRNAECSSTKCAAAQAVHERMDAIPLNRLSLRRRAYLVTKRVFDVATSFTALIMLLPMMAVIAVAIYIDDPHAGPIYCQTRCGRHAKLFRMYKFRTMIANADQMLDSLFDRNEMTGPAFKMKNDPRVTRVGKLLRKTSIDELPQLWNILKGDMSFVGPRPPLPSEAARYSEYQMQKLRVQQGLTCYWQVTPQRNCMDFDEWVALDLQYIHDRCWKTDIRIILKTIVIVLHAKGV